MDPASIALSQGLDSSEPRTYAALSTPHNVPRTTLWNRAHGLPSIEDKARSQQYLNPAEEKALAEYLIHMSAIGYPVPMKCVPSLAFIIRRRRSSKKDETIKRPGKNWVMAFENWNPDLVSRKVKAVDWNRHNNNIYDKITHWFEVIGKVLQNPDVLRENVYTMDETGVMLCMLSSIKVLVSKSDSRSYRGAGVKRTMVTAIECISGNGRSLLPMVIWPATTHRSNWTTYPTPGWHYACSESGYTDSKISLEWLIRVFDPQTKTQAQQKPRVLISDGFGTHETLEILEYCFENNIILCRIPSHTSHKLQPCDTGVFSPLKTAYRDQVERLYRGSANTVGKEHFTSLYSPAREKALTPRNIKAGWAKAGLFPFNLDRVLNDIQNPLAELTAPKADKIDSCLQDEILQTPVTVEALVSLHGLIEQDTHALDERSKQRLQKFVKAAQTSFAKCSLLDSDNQELIRQNNEAKVRRSTKSTIVGKRKGKVMSFEDIERERAKRAAKEAMAASKKRGRKRKGSVAARAEAKKCEKTRKSEVEIAEDEIVAEGMERYCSVFQQEDTLLRRAGVLAYSCDELQYSRRLAFVAFST
jgi:DDE superfamily endonuclease